MSISAREDSCVRPVDGLLVAHLEELRSLWTACRSGEEEISAAGSFSSLGVNPAAQSCLQVVDYRAGSCRALLLHP